VFAGEAVRVVGLSRDMVGPKFIAKAAKSVLGAWHFVGQEADARTTALMAMISSGGSQSAPTAQSGQRADRRRALPS
jgi:hypothetical protein